MPPRKEFTGQVDYLKRSVHDDFLEQFPTSVHEITRGRELIPKDSRELVAEGFYDKANWVRDAQISVGGLDLFKRWFSERNNDSPMNNVWEFDIGKLTVPTVFFDSDLLKDLANRYDPITRWVRSNSGASLFEVNPALIKEVFNLNSDPSAYEGIDIDDLQAKYEAQALFLKAGPLQQHAVRVGTLPVITENTPEPLLKRHFNTRTQALYLSLCQIFGIDEAEQIPGSLVLIMAQTLQFGMNVILDFGTFLSHVIHNGLMGIAKGKLDKPFSWYSMLMYICLYKGYDYFSKDMDLEIRREGEKNPIQLWSVHMASEARGASYVVFDRVFASKLRLLLKGDSPRIPQALLELVRPKDHAKGLLVSHNWGDIIPYNVSTVIRVYGFLGKPHVLPFHVPLKLGIAELLWQIGSIDDRELNRKGTFFPIVTVAHDFVFVRKGWKNLKLFLDKYDMAESHARVMDPEGFYDLLRERIKAARMEQHVYYPEDIIRNIFTLHEQELRKEKWIVFSTTLEFINAFDPKYDPLKDKKYWGAKMQALMNNFAAIIQAMNEKKETCVKAYPERAAEVQRKMNSRNVVTPGQYTLQKRAGYVVIQNVQQSQRQQRQIPGSPPATKRQRLEQGSSSSQTEQYSPSQSPIRIDDEASLREQLKQIGGEGKVIVTPTELEAGEPQEPPAPSLDLTIADYQGKEIDPLVSQASEKFLNDDNFVKSRAFAQFLWRSNIGNFEKTCKRIKAEHPDKSDSAIEEEVKSSFLNDFARFTPEAGRKILKQSGVLLLPEWDIANAIVFDSVRKQRDVKFRTTEEVLQAHRGIKFSDDHQALVMWSMERRNNARVQEVSTAEYTGALTVYRSEEVGSKDIFGMASEMLKFGSAVSSKEEDRFMQLNARFEEVLKAYEDRGMQIQSLENKVSQMEKAMGKRKIGETSQPRIACPPRPLIEPFKATPIVEIPDTPERPQFYTADDFEEEKNKLYASQVELQNQYEGKLRQGIMYMIDRIEWPAFFDLLENLIIIRDELKGNEDKFIPLVQRWTKRSKDITNMCISVIQPTCHQVDKIFELLNKMQGFDDKQNLFHRRLKFYLSKYFTEKFSLFPCALKNVDEIKSKDEWKRDLDNILCERLNKVVSETGHLLWAMTNEELAKVQIFYATIKKDLVDLEAVANSLITVHREILSCDWPDDTVYNEWKNNLDSIEQMSEDEEENDGEVTVTLEVESEDKENPRVKVNLQVIDDDSPLLSLRAAYSDDSE